MGEGWMELGWGRGGVEVGQRKGGVGGGEGGTGRLGFWEGRSSPTPLPREWDKPVKLVEFKISAQIRAVPALNASVGPGRRTWKRTAGRGRGISAVTPLQCVTSSFHFYTRVHTHSHTNVEIAHDDNLHVKLSNKQMTSVTLTSQWPVNVIS